MCFPNVNVLRAFAALMFGALVLLAARLPGMTRVLPLRPVNYLGEISYGIHLWRLRNTTSRTPWPSFSPRASNLVSGR